MRRIGSNHHRRHSASRGNARRDGAEVSSGHSSVSVLHESGRSRRAKNVKQDGAMGGSLLDNETRPGQSSAAQAQDAGLVRILCVAREGAYEHFA